MANLYDTIKSAGDYIAKTAKDASELVKLSVDIRERYSLVNRKFKEIGRQYYKDHKEDEEPEYDEIFLINEAREQVKEMKIRMAELRGDVVCKNCGKLAKDEDIFCSRCGAKLDRPENEHDFFYTDEEFEKEFEGEEFDEEEEYPKDEFPDDDLDLDFPDPYEEMDDDDPGEGENGKTKYVDELDETDDLSDILY